MKTVTIELQAKNGLYISKDFNEDEITCMTVQKPSGEVLYMGTTKDLSDLIDAVNEDLSIQYKEEVL
jgi:hypothetical protein